MEQLRAEYRGDGSASSSGSDSDSVGNGTSDGNQVYSAGDAGSSSVITGSDSRSTQRSPAGLTGLLSSLPAPKNRPTSPTKVAPRSRPAQSVAPSQRGVQPAAQSRDSDPGASKLKTVALDPLPPGYVLSTEDTILHSDVAEPYPEGDVTKPDLHVPVQPRPPDVSGYSTSRGPVAVDARQLLMSRHGAQSERGRVATEQYRKAREAEEKARATGALRQPTGVQKRRHQINQLATDVIRKQVELDEKRKSHTSSRNGARSKYGW